MSEWLDNQKKPIYSTHQLLQARIEEVNPRRELTAEETKRLRKLGGIADKLKRGKNMHQIDNLLAVGVDKISICTSAYENEAFIKKISLNYGKQFVVGSVDYKFNGKAISCYSNNGLVDKNISPIEHCLKLQDMGVGEILLSSIDHEGLMGGYDLSIIKEIRDKIEIPIILSGGAGKAKHFYDGIIAGADALAASSAFLFTELTPKKVKEFLNKLMVDIRI